MILVYFHTKFHVYGSFSLAVVIPYYNSDSFETWLDYSQIRCPRHITFCVKVYQYAIKVFGMMFGLYNWVIKLNSESDYPSDGRMNKSKSFNALN